MAGLLVRVLAVPPKVLYPLVLALTFIGTYALSNMAFDFFLLLIFGIIGYFLSKAKFPTSPLVLACIVGTNMEQYFRRAYKIHNGDLRIFTASPLCKILIALTIAVVFLPFVQDKVKSLLKKNAR